MTTDTEAAAGPPEQARAWPRDRAVPADDGAPVTYTVIGPADGPVVALLPGFLAADVWWRELVPSLVDAGHRVLLFDYRGVDTTEEPATVTRIAADLVAIAVHEALDDMALVAHSMGVQILLAAYGRLAPRVRAVVMLSGSAASPLRTPFDLGLGASAYYSVLQHTNTWLPGPVRRLIWQGGWDHAPFHDLGTSLGLFSTGTDRGVAAAYAREAGGRDPDAALALAADMHAYDGEDQLAQVAVPALVVTGERDPFCSPATVRRMASQMARAEVRIVPRGSHSTLIDDAPVVNGWVLDHLAAST